jgi:DNA-binding PadR family transcriptional regulator
MEKRGWIRGTWVEKEGARRRRFYRLTPRGEKALAQKRRTWREFIQAVDLVARADPA